MKVSDLMREFWEYSDYCGILPGGAMLQVRPDSLVGRVLASITADVIQSIIEEIEE